MIWTNYHGHSHYCDGKFEPERYILRAIDMGLIAYGFSSHAPLPFTCDWSMSRQNIKNYLNEIETLKRKYKNKIEIYCGLEVDYIPQIMGPGHLLKEAVHTDYTIGSIHFVDAFGEGTYWEIDGSHETFLNGYNKIFNHDIKEVIMRYYALIRQMAREDCPDIIGHMDKIKIQNSDNKFFLEFDKFYQKEILATLEEIADTNAIIEVNTRGIYKKKTVQTYPSRWILEKIHDMKIPVMINSDAHHPEEIINCFEKTAFLLKDIGFRHLRVLLQSEWIDVEFDYHGLKISEYA